MPTKTIDEWAFIALCFVVPTLSFSISLFEISSGIFIGLTLVSMIRSKDPRRFDIFKNVFVVLTLLYLAVNILSLTQSAYLWTSARGVFKVVKNLTLCLSAFYIIDSEKRFKTIFEVFLLTSLVIQTDALIQGVIGFDLIRGHRMTTYLVNEAGRLTGPFHHTNDYSAHLALSIFLFIGVLGQGRRFFSSKKFAWIVAGSVLSPICLLGTYSRGAWIAVAISLVLMAIFRKSKLLVAGILLFSAWLIFFSPALVKARVESLWKPKSGTFVERVELWRESFRMIQKSPILGLGINTYAKNEPHFKSPNPPPIDNQYAHNGYLQMAAETGCLGLLMFLLVLALFFWTTCHAFIQSNNLFLKTAGTAFVFGILAFLIHSAFDTNLHSLLLVNRLWLAMGVTLAAARLV